MSESLTLINFQFISTMRFKKRLLLTLTAFVIVIGLFACLATTNPTQVSIGQAQAQPQKTASPSTAISTLQADHIMLRVPNFNETIQWYKDKFGFKEVIQWKEPTLPGVDLAYLELNGFRLEVLGGGNPQRTIPTPTDGAAHTRFQGYRHLCLRTNDVDATLAELNQRGVPTFVAAYNYPPIQRRLGFVLDNNGNAIEFSGPIKSSS